MSDLSGISRTRANQDPVFLKAYNQVYKRLVYLRQQHPEMRDDHILMYIAADNLTDHIRSTT